jgi:site-specific DNA-adenine methylase
MRYPGGKGKCFHQLINLMPPHRTYIEGYLGAGSVMRHKRPAHQTIGIDVDAAVISMWADTTGIELVQADAVAYLQSYKFKGDELVYLDPPYLPSTRRRKRVYRYDYTEEEHERMLAMVVTLPCMVMLSGYASQMYDSYLQGWNCRTFPANSHSGLREERVWFNFEPPAALHDARHLGSTFRDRQTIKRRRERLYERIEGLDPVERHELMAWMKAKFGEVRIT